ncbi:hypothetical protein L208DRAFT_937837 [Tricholoma matsutake]|nr:hypothetical protein L208DRAFT_937837 [Tricholoma matsutake 945]
MQEKARLYRRHTTPFQFLRRHRLTVICSIRTPYTHPSWTLQRAHPTLIHRRVLSMDQCLQRDAGVGPRTAPVPLLPTHHDSHLLSSQAPYPPLSNTWNRLRAWLSREYPELGDTLNYGIPPHDLAHIEMQFGFALPSVVRESYLCCDGQEAESAAGCSEGLFFGLKLLPLEDVLEEWRFWREVDDDPATGANDRLREVMESIPPGWVRKEYSQRGWIPLIADKAGNYVGVDLNPAESGSVGQVIVFGRDFDTKVVLWRGEGSIGWAKWLAGFVDELESGEGIEIGMGNEGSDDSEDDLGYESYFYDGTGRGQGDGGGDTGNSGLRMTGEYRGWNVFEAWADRSLRRWREITYSSLLPQEGEDSKELDSVRLGALEVKAEISTEVNVPVVADVNEPTPISAVSTTLSSVTITGNRPARLDLAAVPGTRLPAPLPLELPTAHDIIPSPSPPDSINSSYHSSFEVDLESGRGRGRGMLEVSRDNGKLVSSAGRSQALPPTPPGDTAVVPVSHSLPSVESSGEAQAPTIDLPDLLTDSAPVMDTKLIDPYSPSSVHSQHPVLQLEPAADAASAPSEEAPAESVVAASAIEVDSDTTVRLVGGGGTAGTTPAIEEELPQTDDTDIASITSGSEIKKGQKTHKKTKSSLASLKKLGHLSGMRKRDSNNSIKVGVSPPPTAV